MGSSSDPMGKRSQTAEIIALMLLFAGIAAMTLFGFARAWMPELASEHGRGVDGVIRYLLVTTGGLLAIGATVFVIFMWRYGRGKASAPPRLGRRAEDRWSLIPVLVFALISEVGVIVKGLPVWEEVYGEPADGALVVEAIAKQFEWLIRFPGPDGRFGRLDPAQIDGQTNPAGLDASDPAAADDIVRRNVLHLPVGRPVHLRLRSRDVLHSFSVAQFRIKQDVVPGVVNSANFVPTIPGTFEIACAELCGMNHYLMGGRTIVHPAGEFEEWLAEQTEAGQ